MMEYSCLAFFTYYTKKHASAVLLIYFNDRRRIFYEKNSNFAQNLLLNRYYQSKLINK